MTRRQTKAIEKQVTKELETLNVPKELHGIVEEFNRNHKGLKEYSESIYNTLLLTAVFNAAKKGA